VVQRHPMQMPLRKILGDAESGAATATATASDDPWEAAISKLAKG
jgi:hypothetical protein